MAYVRKYWLITDLAKEYNATLRSVKNALEDAGLLKDDEPTALAYQKGLVGHRPSRKGRRYTWHYAYVKQILNNFPLETHYNEIPPSLTEQYNQLLSGIDLAVRYNRNIHTWEFFRGDEIVGTFYIGGGLKRSYFHFDKIEQTNISMEQAIESIM